jgi:hypothetical protein
MVMIIVGHSNIFDDLKFHCYFLLSIPQSFVSVVAEYCQGVVSTTALYYGGSGILTRKLSICVFFSWFFSDLSPREYLEIGLYLF